MTIGSNIKPCLKPLRTTIPMNRFRYNEKDYCMDCAKHIRYDVKEKKWKQYFEEIQYGIRKEIELEV